MRIALIRPDLGLQKKKKEIGKFCLEPKSLSILASLTPADDEIRIADDRLEPMPYDEPFDLVALSVGTFQARRAYEIADAFRARGRKVVMGGFHPTFCPEEAAEHADAVAMGEAEGLWPTILEDARRGQLQREYRKAERPELTLPPCRPNVVPTNRYAPMSVVQFGRGCNHNCDFCCIKAYYKSSLRHRPADEVIAEIRRGGRDWVFFADDNLIADRAQAKEFLRQLIPLGIRWVSQTSLDFVDDPELLELMVKSGCQVVIIGLESLDPKNLRQMGKGWSKAVDYGQKLKIIRDNGIMVYGTFVFGYDGDTPDVFARTLDFALEQKLFMANFNHLQPYPGTRLYERLRKESRLVYEKWWLDPAYRFGQACFHPRQMSAEQLTQGAFETRCKFSSWSGIARRFLDFRANAGSFYNALTFLLTNLASQLDIHRKQGIPLGSAKPDSKAPDESMRDPDKARSAA